MRKKINEAMRHPLILGSIVVFGGSTLANLFNFLFNIFMVRNLSVVNYGTLASLISLITISSIPASAFIPTVVRFGASYLARGEYDMVRGFFSKATKICCALGITLFLIFLIFSQNISRFFRISDSSLIVLAGVTVIFNFVVVVNTGLLQAKLSFRFLAFINSMGAFLKLAIGVLLVYLGFAVNGALSALLISSFLPYVFSFIPLKFLFQNGVKVPRIANKELFAYGAPAAISLFSLTSLITTDIILVKHFFDPKSAGIYAGISLIGRVIFFLTAPITTVMFPLIVQKYTRNENYRNIFKLSMFLVLLPSLCLTVFYFLFPEFTIRFFSKDEYTVASSLLGVFGIFLTIYSLLSVLTNFYLSIKETKVAIPIGIGAILQIVLIWFYHQSFLQIIFISSAITGLLLILLLLYYPILQNKNEKL